MSSFKHKAIATVAALLSTAALATPSQIFFGENQSPTPAGSVSGDPLTARGLFSNAFINPGSISSYGFEDQSNYGPKAEVVATFNGVTSTLSGDSLALRGSPSSGRFATGGVNYLEIGVSAASGASFSIAFSTGISAFGFYGTDIGDFDGELKLLLQRADDNSIIEEVVVRSAGNTAANNGSLLFYGFADSTVAYDKITFVSSLRACTPSPTVPTCPTADYFGFDDFVVAQASAVSPTPPSGLPEPGSLALVGVSLLGLAAAGRRAVRR